MEVKEIKKLPKATAKRLPSYLRNLKALESIPSSEIFQLVLHSFFIGFRFLLKRFFF